MATKAQTEAILAARAYMAEQRVEQLEQLCKDLYLVAREGYICESLHSRLVELGFAEWSELDNEKKEVQEMEDRKDIDLFKVEEVRKKLMEHSSNVDEELFNDIMACLEKLDYMLLCKSLEDNPEQMGR